MMTQETEKVRKQMQMVCIDDLVPRNHLLRSPALKPYSFQRSSGVEPRSFTSDLQSRLRSLYTQ